MLSLISFFSSSVLISCILKSTPCARKLDLTESAFTSSRIVEINVKSCFLFKLMQFNKIFVDITKCTCYLLHRTTSFSVHAY